MRRLLAALVVGAALAALGLSLLPRPKDDGRVTLPRLVEPREPPSTPSWTMSRDVYKIRNRDGVWWIFRRCVDRIVGGRRWNVGPGYIARFRDRARRLLVDDFRPRRDVWSPGYLNAVNGGLGTFGFHYARGVPGRTPAGDDPATEEEERRVDRRPPGYAIEGRMCAWSNRGFGVSRVEELGFPELFEDETRFGVDVHLSDGSRSPIAVVEYRYRFRPDSVEQSVAVSTYRRRFPDGAVAFAKEPKVVALLRGGGFRRMSIFGDRFQKGVLEGAPEGTAVLSTDHAADADRRLVRWDYGRRADEEGRDACAEAPCFEARAAAAPGVPWENGEAGFDGWAVAAAARPSTWPRDTDGAGVAWGCPTSPALDGVRRWEFGGWKRRNPRDPVNNVHRYTAAEASFIGWEGGRGPGDCEPLERELVDERWTASLEYGLRTR